MHKITHMHHIILFLKIILCRKRDERISRENIAILIIKILWFRMTVYLNNFLGIEISRREKKLYFISLNY